MYISYIISKKLTSLLQDNDYIKAQDFEACLYCLDYIVEMFLFFCTSFVISMFLHAPFLSLTYFIILLLLRSNCGGYHASSRALCTFLSYIFFFLAFLLMKFYLFLPDDIMITNMVINAFFIFIQPKTISAKRNFLSEQHKKQKRYRKMISISLLITFMVIYSLGFELLAPAIVSCTTISVINLFLAKYTSLKNGK